MVQCGILFGAYCGSLLKHVKADGKAGLYHRRQCVVSYSLTTMALLWLDA